VNDPEPRIENPSAGPARRSKDNTDESADDEHEIRKVCEGDKVSEYIHDLERTLDKAPRERLENQQVRPSEEDT